MGELCNGNFNIEFSFTVADNNAELIMGAGQSDSKNLPGPGGGGGRDALASCTDSAGVCSQLNSGSVSSSRASVKELEIRFRCLRVPRGHLKGSLQFYLDVVGSKNLFDRPKESFA